MISTARKKIVIVGGGFAGVKCALTMADLIGDKVQIILISNSTHFEYHAVLYRVVTGRSPYEVCIPLTEIFKDKPVELIQDHIEMVDPEQRFMMGSSKSHYGYDYLVLALGSEAAHFDIPGVSQHSYSFKNIHNALGLKRHLHEIFKACVISDTEIQKCTAHVVIIGGGASGVELAGEMIGFCTAIADTHRVDHSFVKVDLIEAGSRLLPQLSKEMSVLAKTKLESLGVNVILNKAVLKEDYDAVYLSDAKLKTKTVIWTVGIRANSIFRSIMNFQLNTRGQVVVNDELNPEKYPGVFVLGDSAATKYSGWAQTALYDGDFAARKIARSVNPSISDKLYAPPKPVNVIPVGPYWAIADLGSYNLAGLPGWIVRRIVDLKMYLEILPFSKAWSAFLSTWKYKDSCITCDSEISN